MQLLPGTKKFFLFIELFHINVLTVFFFQTVSDVLLTRKPCVAKKSLMGALVVGQMFQDTIVVILI